MKKILILGLLILVVIALVGCAATANPQTGTPNAEGKVAGFWLGLWHGAIAPITFIISLFNPRVQMYEVHNNGGWYDFGFVIGIGIGAGIGRGLGWAGGKRRSP